MDFRFTEEQEMLAGELRDLLAGACAPADLRRLLAGGGARDAERWSKLAALGLAGVLVPEAAGGLGLGCVDFVLVAEACGAACLPEPLVETAGVALPLLAAAAPDSPLLAGAMAGGITLAVGHPAMPCVADADTAAAVLLPRDGALWLVPAAAARLERQPSADPFRRLCTVDFDPAGADRLAAGRAAERLMADAFDRGALFAAAQLAGIAQSCVDLATAYALQREQFGKPIGANQAVKHMLSSAQVRIEFARPVVHAAAAMAANGDAYSRARISQAKLAASEAADLAARTAIQVHGAMGYSWEVDVHFFLKRAIALTGAWGTPALHRARVAERVLTRPLGPDMTFATESADA